MDANEILGDYFPAARVTYSETAVAHHIDNSLPAEYEGYARKLAEEVLKPIWESYGSFHIDSWYRCADVNHRVGGSENPPSAHMQARAVDIIPSAMSVEDLFTRLCNDLHLPIDKVIIEHGAHSKWVHVQIAKDGEEPRHMALKAVWNPNLNKFEYERV